MKRLVLIVQMVALLLAATSVGANEPTEAAGPLAVAEIQREAPVDFESEILPILRRNCLACHNAATAKSDLVLETPQTIANGGASGATVEPGQADESLLLAVASHAGEPIMPPADNRVGAQSLTPEELGLIKLWINQGAAGEVKNVSSAPQWQPLPPGVHPVLAVAISPDGQYAACGRANQIFVYHVPTGRLVARLTDPNLLSAGLYENAGVAHLDIVQALAFSPDGSMLASGGYREAKLWQRSSDPVLTEATLPAEAELVASSPDGRWTAVAGADHRVRLLEADNQAGPTLVGHTAHITGLAFVDAETLATASVDGTLRRWRAADGALLAQQQIGTPLNGLAVLAGGQVALAGEDGLVRIVAVGGVAPRELLAGVEANALAVSPDQQLIAVARRGGPIDVLRLADGQLIKTLAGHDGGATALAFLPDGARVASAGADKLLRVWELERGQSVAQVSTGEDLLAALVVLDNDQIVTGSSRGATALWTIGDEALAPLGEAPSEPSAVVGLARAADGQVVYVARAAGSVAAVQVADAQVRFTIDMESALAALAVTPDGQTLLAGQADGQVRAFQAADGQLVGSAAAIALDGPVTGIVVSADATRLLVTSATGEVRLIERASGLVLERVAPAGAERSFGTFTSAPSEAVAVLAGGRLRVAPTAGLRVLPGAGQPVTAIAAVGTDGKLLAAGGADKLVRVYDLATGAVAKQFELPAAVTALAVRGDGQRLAAAAADGLVRLWNLADGAQLAEFKGDFRTNQLLARLTTYTNLAKTNNEAADKALVDARTAIDTTAAEVKSTGDALAAADKTAAEATAVAKQAGEAKDVAAKLLAEADAALKTAADAKTAAETTAAQAQTLATATSEAAQQATAAAEAQAQAQASATAAVEKLKAAVTAAPADEALKSALAAAEKAAAEAATATASAKATADGATQAATNYTTSATQAAAALEAANQASAAATEQQAQVKEQFAAAEKTANDTAAAAKQASEALTAAQRKSTDAQAAAQRAQTALPIAETQAREHQALFDEVSARHAATEKLARERETPLAALAFSPGGQLLATTGASGLVQIYQGDSAQGTASLAASPTSRALGFASDGEVLIGGRERRVRRMTLEPTWVLARVIGPPEEAPLAVEHSLLVDRVGALAFNPDGQWLATGGGEPSRSGELKVWNVADGALVHDFADAHSDTVLGVDFSWDGRYLASCGADKFVKVWDLPARLGVRSYEGHTHHVLGVAWRWDGEELASCGADGAIKLWGFDAGEQLRTLGNLAKQLTGIDYVADSNQLVSSGADAAVHRYNGDDGKGVRNYGGATDFLYCVAVTADGALVAAGGADGVLRIWNAADGKLVVEFGPQVDAASAQAGQAP